MLATIVLLILLLVSLYVILKTNVEYEPVVENKRIPSCLLYKNLIVPGQLDWDVEVIEDFSVCSPKMDGNYNVGIDIINDNQLLLQIKDAQTKNLPIVWVYNPYEESAKFWKDFMSRRNRQTTSGLRRLCLTTILKHFPEYNYRIVVFNQDNLESLMGYEYSLCRPLYPYLKNEYIKYALLEKYGGYWIPIDTVIMRQMNNTLNDYYNDKLIVNGFVSTQYKDLFSYDSMYISCRKQHPIIKNIVGIIRKLGNTFQNEIHFKDTIHKYFQEICEKNDKLVSRYNMVSFLNNNGEMLSFEDLYSQNNNMPPINTLTIIPTHYDITMKKHMWNYIERMDTQQLLESEMWITYAIQMSLK
jgi:hypothetical protein